MPSASRSCPGPTGPRGVERTSPSRPTPIGVPSLARTGPPAAAPAPARLLQDQAVRASAPRSCRDGRRRVRARSPASRARRSPPGPGTRRRGCAGAASPSVPAAPARSRAGRAPRGCARPGTAPRPHSRSRPRDPRSPVAARRPPGRTPARPARRPAAPAALRPSAAWCRLGCRFGSQRAHDVCDRGSTPEGSRLTAGAGDGRTLAAAAPVTVGRDEPDPARRAGRRGRRADARPPAGERSRDLLRTRSRRRRSRPSRGRRGHSC